MKGEALAFFPHLEVQIAALGLFAALFIGIVIWTLRKSAKEHYDRQSRLPLEESKK